MCDVQYKVLEQRYLIFRSNPPSHDFYFSFLCWTIHFDCHSVYSIVFDTRKSFPVGSYCFLKTNMHSFRLNRVECNSRYHRKGDEFRMKNKKGEMWNQIFFFFYPCGTEKSNLTNICQTRRKIRKATVKLYSGSRTLSLWL